MKTYATRIVAPATQPVSLTDAKELKRIALAGTSDDSLLADLITTATQQIEDMTGRALITQTWRFDTGPLQSGDILNLTRHLPVQSLSGVEYRDTAGNVQTAALADFEVVHDRDSAVIAPVVGAAWPNVGDWRDAIRVTLVVGYGDAADVPGPLRSAILYLVHHLFHPSEVLDPKAVGVPKIVHDLVDRYRLGWVAG